MSAADLFTPKLVTILREGKRVFEGAVGGLHEDDLLFDTDLDSWEKAVPLIHALGGEIPMPGRIRLPHGSDPAVLVESLVRNGVRLRAFAPVRRSLEDLYMEILNGAGIAN